MQVVCLQLKIKPYNDNEKDNSIDSLHRHDIVSDVIAGNGTDDTSENH
jgi:hypothetical protein